LTNFVKIDMMWFWR